MKHQTRLPCNIKYRNCPELSSEFKLPRQLQIPVHRIRSRENLHLISLARGDNTLQRSIHEALLQHGNGVSQRLGVSRAGLEDDDVAETRVRGGVGVVVLPGPGYGEGVTDGDGIVGAGGVDSDDCSIFVTFCFAWSGGMGGMGSYQRTLCQRGHGEGECGEDAGGLHFVPISFFS